jgi:hypothetical protein
VGFPVRAAVFLDTRAVGLRRHLHCSLCWDGMERIFGRLNNK